MHTLLAAELSGQLGEAVLGIASCAMLCFSADIERFAFTCLVYLTPIALWTACKYLYMAENWTGVTLTACRN